MIKKYIFQILLGFVFFNAIAQAPNWSVNASQYQYSMTVTAFLNVNGTTLSSTEDKVAAFVNGEIRGIGTLVYVDSYDKYVAYMSIYANTNGEAISFKIYNSASQDIIDVAKTETFTIDGNLGGVFQSYSIASPTLSNEAQLNSFSFLDITTVSVAITTGKVDIMLPSGTDITALSPQFNISDGAVFYVNNSPQVSAISIQNFTNTIRYKLLSENQAVLAEYDINVSIEGSTIEAPNLTLTSDFGSLVKEGPVQINIATNVPISALTNESLDLINCVASSILKIDNFNYLLKIVPIQQGAFAVKISENKVFNAENEGNLVSNKLIFTYDLVRPYLLSIKRKNPLQEITNSNSLEFHVLFSEAVDNVFATSFESVLDAQFSIVKESEASYMITITGVEDFNGAVSLNIKSTNTIKDKAGNLLLNSTLMVHQN